jgi:hypothetical protein
MEPRESSCRRPLREDSFARNPEEGCSCADGAGRAPPSGHIPAAAGLTGRDESSRRRPESPGSWSSCPAHLTSLDVSHPAHLCQSPNTRIQVRADTTVSAPSEHVSRVDVISGEPHSHKSQSQSQSHSHPGRMHRHLGRGVLILLLGLLISVTMLPTALAGIARGDVSLTPSGVLEMTASWIDSPKTGAT